MSQLPPGVEPLELPEPYRRTERYISGPITRNVLFEPGDYYTANQMREHEAKAAQAGYLAGLEAAAKACEQSQWPYVVPAIRSLKGKQ